MRAGGGRRGSGRRERGESWKREEGEIRKILRERSARRSKKGGRRQGRGR